MSEHKHTPGPWRGNGDESALLDENRSIVSESGQEVLTIGWGGSACESDPYGEYPILEASDADWALLLAAPDLLAACETLVSSLDALIAESDGVYGLHLNGDNAPWSDLIPGGRFDGWLCSIEEARAAIAKAKGE